MSFTGHVQNGMVVFDGPTVPAEGSTVRVEVVAAEKPAKTSRALEHYKDAIGKIVDLPPDGSLNIDHYLYGHPKR